MAFRSTRIPRLIISACQVMRRGEQTSTQGKIRDISHPALSASPPWHRSTHTQPSSPRLLLPSLRKKKCASLLSSSSSSFSSSLVMSTHKVEDSPIRTYSTMANGFGPKTPFLIGVAGGTASGKSTVCKRIMEKLGQDDIEHSQRRVVCISQDAFYRPLNPEESAKALKGVFNFDHPDAFDNDLVLKTLQQILDGKICKVPNYDFVTNSRLESTTTIYPADVVLFEGILMFYHPEIRNLFHMKLFVDSDADTRLARRVMRDTRERNRALEMVLHQYTNLVKPAFEEFCLPTKKFADVIIPRGAENIVAINLIVQHIQEIVNDRSGNGTGNGTQHRSRSNSDSKIR